MSSSIPRSNRSTPALVALVAVSLLVLTAVGASMMATAETGCPPPDYSVGIAEFHQLIVMQGDDPRTDLAEPKSSVQVLHRTYWHVPWNSSEVYVSVPADAANILVDHVTAVPHANTSVFIPGQYSFSENAGNPPEIGEVEGGDYDGFYYWRFMPGADRNSFTSLEFDTQADLEDYDEEFTDPDEWAIGDGVLSLAENVSAAAYTSKRYLGGEDIISVNMTLTGEGLENASLEVTVDNGTTWLPAESGVALSTQGGGNEFRWRMAMTQNTSSPGGPVLDAVVADVVFKPQFTDLWLETTFTMWIPEEGLDFSLMYPFDITSSSLVFVGYTDEDMEFTVTGMVVTPSPDPTYQGKVTYLHMQGANECVVTLDYRFQVEPGSDPDFPWLVYLLPLVLVVLIGLLYYFSRSPDEDGEGEDGDGEDDDEDDGDEDEEDHLDLDDMDRGDLEERKSALMASIKRLEAEHADGVVGDDELEIRREMYKAEAIEVMRRLHEMGPDDGEGNAEE